MRGKISGPCKLVKIRLGTIDWERGLRAPKRNHPPQTNRDPHLWFTHPCRQGLNGPAHGYSRKYSRNCTLELCSRKRTTYVFDLG